MHSVPGSSRGDKDIGREGARSSAGPASSFGGETAAPSAGGTQTGVSSRGRHESRGGEASSRSRSRSLSESQQGGGTSWLVSGQSNGGNGGQEGGVEGLYSGSAWSQQPGGVKTSQVCACVYVRACVSASLRV